MKSAPLYLAIISLFLFLGFLIAALPTQAAPNLAPSSTITVGTLLDTTGGGSCTLRDAIVAANTHTATGACSAGAVGADTINFSVTGVITLTSGLPNITDTLTINGPGAGQLTLDGGGTIKAFQNLNSGVALTLANLTIAHSSNPGSAGGVLSSQGTMNISNVTFSGNTDSFSTGVIANGGVMTITNSTFTGNTSTGTAGALANTGTIYISGTLFSGNHSQGGSGGALFNNSGSPSTIINSTFVSNTAFTDGGAILNAHGDITITNSTFGGSPGANSAQAGGAISNEGGNANIIGSGLTFSNNSATSLGGGIYDTGGTLNLTNSTLTGNHASSGNGGGIYSNNSRVLINESAVLTNTAAVGGGMYIDGFDVAITNTTFSGNSATTNSGGAMLINAVPVNLVNVTISGNSANTTGGGIQATGGVGPVNLLNTLLASNTGGNCSGNAGNITSSGHNLSTDATCTSFLAGTGDQNSVSTPLLGSLANNGGSSLTIALLTGSPAIDAGSNSGCPISDQRGISRPKDGDGNGTTICDIGAYEAPTVGTASLTNYLPVIEKH